MPRPTRIRRIFFNPRITYFKPAGVMLKDLQESVLTRDELEVIRLIDYENIGQTNVAKKMGISQPTLSRILKSARKKIADALINGQAIRVKGGDYEMVQPRGRGLGFGRGIGRGAGGRGRMGGTAEGPGGKCKCPKCGTEASHPIGVPCYQMRCPKCGEKMTRV
jgi:predicted DNA-binding protein (UPF0251 family)